MSKTRHDCYDKRQYSPAGYQELFKSSGFLTPQLGPVPPLNLNSSRNGFSYELRSRKDQDLCLKPHELVTAMKGLVETIRRQKPYSLPFILPVNPDVLPIYYSVISDPMNLEGIKLKLENGWYSDAWSVLDDFRLIFANAREFNAPTSTIRRYCNTLEALFEVEADKVMKSLGYCCGRQEKFPLRKLVCFGKLGCFIPLMAKYYSCDDGSVYCRDCFIKVEIENPEKYVQLLNNKDYPEPFVVCQDCGRRFHQFCVLHLEKKVDSSGFSCDTCLKKKNKKRLENPFTAQALPESKLSKRLETRVNRMLKKGKSGARHVTVRVVSSTDKVCVVQEEMRKRYVESGEMSGELSYLEKVILAFETVQDHEICFFGLVVHEFGSEAGSPNTRRIYLAYLDSVRYFFPDSWRTCVYQEIFLGYLDHAKKLGYKWCHIWACPPQSGVDYIFHQHPASQKKPPDQARLVAWYRTVLEKGRAKGDLVSFQTLLEQVRAEKWSSIAQFPYFEGDYWPDFLEQALTVKQKVIRGRVVKTPPPKGNNPWGKLLDEVQRNAKQFLVVRLLSDKDAQKLGPIRDPDPRVSSELFNLGLVRWCSAQHVEFSTFRRAKHTTKAILWELHQHITPASEETASTSSSTTGQPVHNLNALLRERVRAMLRPRIIRRSD